MDSVDVNELVSYYENTLGRLHTEVAVLLADNKHMKEELDDARRTIQAFNDNR